MDNPRFSEKIVVNSNYVCLFCMFLFPGDYMVVCLFVCLLIVLGWYPLCHRKSLEPCTYRKGPVGCQRLSLQPAGTCRAAFLASLTEGQYLLPPPFGRTYLANKSRARPYQVLKATDDGHAHHQVHRYPACHASGSWGRIHSPTVFSSF